jgi:GTP-binding protein
MTPLFQLLVNHVPAPKIDPDPAFRMLVTTLEADNFLGRILTGRILSGSIKPNTMVKALGRDGKELEQTRITRILAFRGLERVALDSAEAGDIVAIAGMKNATVADTLGDLTITSPIHSQPIDPPTLAMTFMVNDSPLAGREGDKVTSRMIRDRLMREAEGNVAIRVTDTENKPIPTSRRSRRTAARRADRTMRREGFELVHQPSARAVQDRSGHRPAPGADRGSRDRRRRRLYRRRRRADLAAQGRVAVDMRPSGAGKTRLVFYAPSRGLIGYHGEFLTDTRGTGVMNRLFHEYGALSGPIEGRRNGVL